VHPLKQVCPSCLKSVEVPESAAGTDYPCLVCGSKIPVPKNYSPSVAERPPADRPPPPPGLAPPAKDAPPPPPTTPGDETEFGVSLAPGILAWVPAFGLTLLFLLTFLPWIGAYPGGHRLFSQNAWEAFAASHTPNAVPTELEDVEKYLNSSLRYGWLLLVYVIGLILAIFFAWADRFLPDEVSPTTLPGPLVWLMRIWPARHGLLIILGVGLLALVLVQGWKGLGLENAIRDYAAAKYDEETKAADTELKKTTARVKVGMEYAKYAIATTTVFSLVFWLHAAVAAALLIRTKPNGRPIRLALKF
jgi:hypothetical protein